MSRLLSEKNAVFAVFAAVGSLIAAELGGWDAVLKALIIFLAADFLLGLAAAALFQRSPKSKNGALDSRACFQGLVRKLTVLLFVWLGATLDRLLGAAYLRTAVCLFFIANEGLSILENTALIGVPWPPAIQNALEVLKDQSGDGKESGRWRG